MPSRPTQAETVPPSGKVGRPSSLSEATRKSVQIAILGLSNLDESFRNAGIHPSTGHRWMALGRKQKRGEYRDFYELVEDARARIKVRLQAKVSTAALSDPRMALEVLARRYPEWRKHSKVEIEDKTPGAGKRDNIRERVVSRLDQIEARLAKVQKPEPDAAGE